MLGSIIEQIIGTICIGGESSLVGGEMSELNRLFKNAVLGFEHADDFVISFWEGAHMIAENISDHWLDERRSSLPEKTAVYLTQSDQEDIGAAVAFSERIFPFLLAMQVSLFEDCLLEICEEIARFKQIPFRERKQGRFTVQQARLFMENELTLEFPNPWQAWEKIEDILRLNNIVLNRNCYVSDDDLPFIQACTERYNEVFYDGILHSVSFGDRFLIRVNATIVSFFTELQDLLPEFFRTDEK